VKDRFESFVWLLVALLLMVLLIAPRGTEVDLSRPLTDDERPAGLAALARWLQRADVPVATLRDRYQRLDALAARGRGNLLVVHVPLVVPLEMAEVRALHAWVEAGNTLLVSVPLMESPIWAYRGGNPIGTVELLSGLRLEYRPRQTEGDEPSEVIDTDPRAYLDTPAWVVANGAMVTRALQAVDAHPLAANADTMVVPWDMAVWQPAPREADDTTSQSATPAGNEAWDPDRWHAVMRHADLGPDVLWESLRGDGSVLVLGHPSLLTNAAIALQGNRQFAINVVAQRLDPGGTVIFDDAHQGENDFYTANDLLADPRLYYTLGFVLVCWVAYVLADAGTWERAIARARPQKASSVDLVRASGRYLARRLTPSEAANGLLDTVTERLARKWQLPRERALEEGLVREGEVMGDVAERLRKILGEGGSRKAAPNLQRLHNLLLEIHRGLS
jgi:hypothetical protein